MNPNGIENDLANCIAEFLVAHDDGPRVENVDVVRWDDCDVRQDALYRCLRVFEKRGVEVTDENLITVLDGHRDAAIGNLKFARIDALRRLRGRGTQKGKNGRTLRTAHEFDGWVWDGGEESSCVDGAVPDPNGNCAHDRIEEDFEGELKRIYERATPSEQKAMRLLAEWQRRKEYGENTYPLRKPIHKIKAKLKAEGSQFDLNPRYL